jgi:hypothetical protein
MNLAQGVTREYFDRRQSEIRLELDDTNDHDAARSP